VPNRLAESPSLYLLQHKDNPVDWWPWCDEAFAESRRRDVPVLLSVGYAACHWCHVMAHESFEDVVTAAQMNEHFVCIKVDREERPDVDAVYMAAVQALTGHGGWPMTAFLTPAGRPFFAGTYYPPTPRPGMASFRQVLAAVSATWVERRVEVDTAADGITARLAQMAGAVAGAGAASPAPPSEADLTAAVAVLAREHDPVRGGFGGAPKFPPTTALEFLLRHHGRTGDPVAAAMVATTCTAMARGGLFDQVGGGFARYATDADWVVPHFEKMLYDNAGLLRVYAHWWRAGADPLAAAVARRTATFLLTELATPQGGFASSLDADAAGREGSSYVWTPDQLRDALGGDDAAWAGALLGVGPRATFEEGASVPTMRADPDDPARWAEVRGRLLAARALRPQPARDDKVVAGWNGMAVAALAEAGTLGGRADWVAAAQRCAELLLAVHGDGTATPRRLRRVSRDGVVGVPDGTLEDQALVADGLLALFAATGHPRWLHAAGSLLDGVLADFGVDGGFADTAHDAEVLITRPHELGDGPTPGGQAAAAAALATYAAYTGSQRHRAAAETALAAYRPLAARYPRAAGWALAVAEALVDGPRQVAVVGAEGDPATQALRRVAAAATAPGLVVAYRDPAAGDPEVALLEDRPLLGGAPAAYVCQGFVCALPTADPATLAGAVGARAAVLSAIGELAGESV